ncbi:conserved hypothetical protein [Ricinus communis]|uniref:Uncharacterized protein n=1 Tax=Ricinus communis TaxID=3988 RepID=B9S7Z2_RICCO|nr:conserved hypothetical protein [Ricinus communis]
MNVAEKLGSYRAGEGPESSINELIMIATRVTTFFVNVFAGASGSPITKSFLMASSLLILFLLFFQGYDIQGGLCAGVINNPRWAVSDFLSGEHQKLNSTKSGSSQVLTFVKLHGTKIQRWQG